MKVEFISDGIMIKGLKGIGGCGKRGVNRPKPANPSLMNFIKQYLGDLNRIGMSVTKIEYTTPRF